MDHFFLVNLFKTSKEYRNAVPDSLYSHHIMPNCSPFLFPVFAELRNHDKPTNNRHRQKLAEIQTEKNQHNQSINIYEYQSISINRSINNQSINRSMNIDLSIFFKMISPFFPCELPTFSSCWPRHLFDVRFRQRGVAPAAAGSQQVGPPQGAQRKPGAMRRGSCG